VEAFVAVFLFLLLVTGGVVAWAVRSYLCSREKAPQGQQEWAVAEPERQRQVAAEPERQRQVAAEPERQRQVAAEAERLYQRTGLKAFEERQWAVAEVERQRQVAEAERQRQAAKAAWRQRQAAEAERLYQRTGFKAFEERQRAAAPARERQRAAEAERERQRAARAERERQRAARAERERQSAARVGIATIDEMSGVDFERYVADRLRQDGWNVSPTRATGDYGVDLIAKKDGRCFAVQCKRYGKPVGIRAVQQVVSGAMHYDCKASMVVSNQEFTPQAKELASTHNCVLIGRSKLPGTAWI
jgi:hypothetical protein